MIDLRDEVVGLARDLIAIDTSNPPGRETPAAELLRSYLDDAGADCELVGPDPERLNLVARVRGGDGPSLMLIAHTDVVPAPAADWTVPPFEGRIRDGQLVGRGAADMKGELAARAVALAATARAAEPPPGDVVLVAEADEERNTADVGMSWLVRERPDLRCDFALNEGGGLFLPTTGGGGIVDVSVGEKRVGSLRVRIFGQAGHASLPVDDHTLLRVATAIERLLGHESPAQPLPGLLQALREVGAPAGPDDSVLAWAAAQHPILARSLPAITRLTVMPTGLATTEPANVIPPCADVTCDCRALPGQTTNDVAAHVKRALGEDLRYELEFLEPLEGGTESPIDTPLYRAIESYVAERLPDARLLPIVTPGFTDSHWVRSAWGSVAYGFAPVFTTDAEAYTAAAHAPNEAIALDDLAEMARFHLHAIQRLSG